MINTKFLCFSAMMLSASCSGENSKVLLIGDINSHPDQFDHNVIIVKGYLQLSTEGWAMYESLAKWKEFDRALTHPEYDIDSYLKYCLTIQNNRFFVNHLELDGKEVIVRGTYIAKSLAPGEINFGGCGTDPAIVVDIPELRKRLKIR